MSIIKNGLLFSILRRLRILEKDSHPPKPTVPYDTYVRDMKKVNDKIMILERKVKFLQDN